MEEEIDLHAAIGQIEIIIGSSASAIISNPEYNMNRLKDLLSCLNRTQMGPFDARDHRKTILAFHKLIVKAATKIFESVIPSYRIKQHDSEDRVQVRKEIQKLRQHERALSAHYKSFLDYAKRMLDSIKNKPSSTFYTDLIKTDMDDRASLAETACESFGRLLVAHPHFNYCDQLIGSLVEYCAQTRNEHCSELARRYLSQALRDDKLGEVSLEIVNVTNEMTKKRKLSFSPNLLMVLLNLKLIDVKTIDAEDKKKHKEEKEKLAALKKQQSRKERKRMKKMKKLKSELLEAEAHNTTDQKFKYHKQILKKLFLIYLRLLKYHNELDIEPTETQKFVKLVPSVLEGVAKFAHLLDVALCNDMFPLMRKLLSNNNIPSNCKLHCLCTVFVMYRELVTELGSVDPETFYKQFYIILGNISATTMDEQQFSSLISCIHLMLLKRAKNINNKRYFAFVRRLLVLTLNLHINYVPRLLEAIRIMFIQRSSVQALLDSSNGSNFGSGQYDMEMEDPDFCHADGSVAWELHMLRNHVNPLIRDTALTLVSGSVS